MTKQILGVIIAIQEVILREIANLGIEEGEVDQRVEVIQEAEVGIEAENIEKNQDRDQRKDIETETGKEIDQEAKSKKLC